MVAETTGQGDASIGSGLSVASARDRGRLSIWVWLFIIGLIIPLFVYAGPLRLSVYRLSLLVAFFPALFYWLGGRVGSIRLPDICVVVICVWSTLSMVIMDGGLRAAMEAIGILWIETLGAYLLGRCYIRTPEAFYAVVRLFFRIAIVMIPFAIYELYAGPSPIVDFFGKIGRSYGQNPNPGRLGLERVQGPFSHPIHFGVFFGGVIGMFYYVMGYGRSRLYRIRNAALALFLCFSSLSSGPLIAAMSQLTLLTWDGILRSVRNRWYIFVGLAFVGYVTIDLISDRTPFHVVISYLSFNPATGYNRIRIWEYGSANIWANPLFGVGQTGDWARPYWMNSSMDMFWIVPAVRHGVVVWIAYLTLFFSIFLGVIYRRGLSDRVQWYRMGYLCSMAGLFAVGWTVHFWNVPFVLLMFLLGAGVWFLDWESAEDDNPAGQTAAPQSPGYTRFPGTRAASATRSLAGASGPVTRRAETAAGDLR